MVAVCSRRSNHASLPPGLASTPEAQTRASATESLTGRASRSSADLVDLDCTATKAGLQDRRGGQKGRVGRRGLRANEVRAEVSPATYAVTNPGLSPNAAAGSFSLSTGAAIAVLI
jgi:hypothetical protein